MIRATLRTLAPAVVLVAGILTLAALFPRTRAKPDCDGPRFIGLIAEEPPPTILDCVREYLPQIHIRAGYPSPLRARC